MEPPGTPSTVGLLFIAGGFNNQLAFGPLKVPGQRSRMHSGLASPWEGGSVYYHSAFYVRDGARIEARPGIPRKPVVFLIDASSALPPIAPALQAAGKARIVAEGGRQRRFAGGDAAGSTLPGRRRGAAPHHRAGLRGRHHRPEPGPGRARGSQTARCEAALELARDPGAAAPPARRKLPAYATPRREEAYG